jgi:Polymerase beta, Nucleotidyltransferase
MPPDPFLDRLTTALAGVPGVAAIVLGGSRARGTDHADSDYDIGLYFSEAQPLDTERLLEATRALVDDPDAADVTPVGGWGPWIVGGGWLSIERRKVDLLYRNIEAVAKVIDACRAGDITMHYQPGHPHGFCSAIWMGEVALCRPLHDPRDAIAKLKVATLPYPLALREALIRRFQWEMLFSIENAELAVSRGEQTHVAGCAYRALACLAQVLFALNGRYLINEKGALQEAAGFALTIPSLTPSIAEIWRLIGAQSFATLREIDGEVQALTDQSAECDLPATPPC